MIRDPDIPGASTRQTSHLLEQLMQIARISALEEMASGIAHELNQPIGAITTFAQTGARMLNLPAPMVGDAREILHHIGNEALKAGRGIHRIRGLFRGMDSAIGSACRPMLEQTRHDVGFEQTCQGQAYHLHRR